MSVGRGNRNVRTKAYKSRLAHLGDHVAKLAEQAFKIFSLIRKILPFTIIHSTTPIEAGTESRVERFRLRFVIGQFTWWTAIRMFGIGLVPTKITISSPGANRMAGPGTAYRR